MPNTPHSDIVMIQNCNFFSLLSFNFLVIPVGYEKKRKVVACFDIDVDAVDGWKTIKTLFIKFSSTRQ